MTFDELETSVDKFLEEKVNTPIRKFLLLVGITFTICLLGICSIAFIVSLFITLPWWGDVLLGLLLLSLLVAALNFDDL